MVAITTISLFILVLRWSHAKPKSLVTAAPRVTAANDYGLLVPVARPNSSVQAANYQALLKRNGVESTVAKTTDGIRILVWPHQVTRASELLQKGGYTPT